METANITNITIITISVLVAGFDKSAPQEIC